MINSISIFLNYFRRRIIVKYFVFSLFIWGTSNFSSGQEALTPVQRAWLYRIVMKTPVLKTGMGNCFRFDETPYIFRNKIGYVHTNFDAILDFQVTHPESLIIYYDSIKALSPGLVSEVTTKLALWELNEDLKYSVRNPDSCRENITKSFIIPLEKSLPEKLRQKKRDAAIGVVINPSLPIFKKIELLNDVLKSDITHQKRLFNLWRKLVADYSFKRSVYYFNMLAPDYVLESSLFLAAGEGSGTAGLLYESEIDPNDSTNIYWYGKGIGLFSYDVSAHKGKLFPKEQTEGDMKLLSDNISSLHISLWGLNSSYKPLIIVTVNNKSYHLFARFEGKELSPDGSQGDGLSYIDRINQYKKLKVDDKYEGLNDESPLVSALKREYAIKDEVEAKISVLEQEIDSLKEEPGSSSNAIDARRRMIDIQLTILQKKRVRIAYLEKKLSKEYSAIAKAEAKVSKMQELLGPDVQSWRREDSLYIFEDSVIFNSKTHDLVFPKKFEDSFAFVRLISASYSLFGKNKDEVQLSVNLTNALPQFQKPKVVPVKQMPDILHTFYYFPDRFHSFSQIDDTVRKQISGMISLVQKENRAVIITIAPFPDSVASAASECVSLYPDRQKEFRLPVTSMGRRRKSYVTVGFRKDTLLITAYGMTDEVPTRLSMVDASFRKKLGVTGSGMRNNRFLAALRAMDAASLILHDVEPFIQKKWLTGISCEFDISTEEMVVLKEVIFIIKP